MGAGTPPFLPKRTLPAAPSGKAVPGTARDIAEAFEAKSKAIASELARHLKATASQMPRPGSSSVMPAPGAAQETSPKRGLEPEDAETPGVSSSSPMEPPPKKAAPRRFPPETMPDAPLLREPEHKRAPPQRPRTIPDSLQPPPKKAAPFKAKASSSWIAEPTPLMQSSSKAVGRLSDQRLGTQSVEPAPGARPGPAVFDLTESLVERYEPLRRQVDNRRKYQYRRERYGFGQVKRHGRQKTYCQDPLGNEYTAQAWMRPDHYKWLRYLAVTVNGWTARPELRISVGVVPCCSDMEARPVRG